MPKHIGIVAVSPEGAGLFYRQLSRHAAELPSGRAPRVSMHAEPFAEYLKALADQDWHAVGELLRRSAEALAKAGAEFCLTPDNAVQHGVQLAEAGSPIPWLGIPDLVAEAAVKEQRKVVGLIGTRMVTTGSTYQTLLGLKGIQVIAPSPGDIEEMNRIIFEELIYGKIKVSSQRTVLGIIESLASQGCDGVILASSEAPLLVTRENSRLPVYDAADLLATGALHRAAGQ